MKYFDTKKDSLEEAISKAINEKKLDPVGKEDGDIDNDGDKDASDKYLAKRRKAITKAIKKDQKEESDLEEKTTKDVDETLDKIREANIQKGKTMRSILADIWKMNEGKSPFDKEEGFKSDAQRKAAFASGYKEKGKKKEEVEKSSKTATGKKATKVEIEPEIK